jgi:hypothetical protein
MCAATVTRFRFSCLACRMRRRWYGKYQIPQFYIKYVYRNIAETLVGGAYQASDGRIFTSNSSGKIKVTRSFYVLVDPGRFLAFRLAAIKVLDGMIRWPGRSKPMVEFAEFFANYPR